MKSPLDSPLVSMRSPFGRARSASSQQMYNGNPVFGAAILPAGTTGNHNGSPVIGVRNINTWPAPAQDGGRDVLGVDVRSGGNEFPPYQLGINVNHQLATGTGWGYHFTNLIRGAWQVRNLSGATLDANGWPNTTGTSTPYVLIECPRFSDGQADPYTGRHWLITNYACDIEVIQKQASGVFPDVWNSGVTAVDGSVTPTEIAFDVPRISGPNYIYLRMRNISSKDANPVLALVHDRYLQDYKDSNGAAYLNTDIVNNYITPLATAEDTPRKIYRSMKFTKANADPRAYPSAAYDADNLSYHSGFSDLFDQLNPRNKVNTTAAVTVEVGETITQATSGASGTVYLPNTADGTPVVGTQLYLDFVTGTFDTTNELTGSVSGALGADSVPTSIITYGPTENATPYEVLVDDAVYWGYVPWICLQPNISNTDFDAFCTHLTSAFAAGLTEVYIELGNEPWLMNGINSADWFRDMGVAKWGSGTMYGTSADIGRHYKARLDMIFYDRMRTNLSSADFAKVKWTACDQPGYIPGLNAYLCRDAGNPWSTTAAGDGETALYNEWSNTDWTGSITNPITCWSWATYWGNGSDNIDWADQAEVEASLRNSINTYVGLIGSSTNYIRAVLAANVDNLEFLSYEGGYSVYGRPHNFEDTQMMYDLYYEAYNKFRAVGNTGTLLYADLGPPQGTNGDWNHGIDLVNGLTSKYRGRALIDYAQDMRDEATPATGTHNGSAVRGVVLITDGSTTYNGLPVEPVNFLTGIAGAGGSPTYMRAAIHLIEGADTLIPPTVYEEGDYLLFYAGVDRGNNVNANVWFGEDVNDTSWTKHANVQSGSSEFYTEGWLWGKVAGVNEPAPTLHLDGSPPVSQHGQGIFIVLKNVDNLDDVATSALTSTSQTTPWTTISGVTTTADNSLVLVFSTDRQPKQQWSFTSHSLTEVYDGAAGSLGNLSTSFFGYFAPGTAGATGSLSTNWGRNYYRPHAIVAAFSKA